MPNIGKTTTLNLVWNKLCNNGGTSTNRQSIGGNPNDFSDIVLYKRKKVAFYTMGDYSNLLANAIYQYDRQNCDDLICALSINTPKIRANNAISRYNCIRINKKLASGKVSIQQANDTNAQAIFMLI